MIKRRFSGILALILAAALLCSCAQLLPEQRVACGDLTITLPGSFLDLSEEAFAQDFEMVYGFSDQAVSVIREPIAELAPYYPELDARGYAALAVEAYGLSSAVEEVDGIPTFTYTAEAEGMDFTYIVGVFQSDTDFFMVQSYCATENFAKNKAAMWAQIASVTIG